MVINDSSIVLFLIINIKPINKFKKALIKSFGLPSSRYINGTNKNIVPIKI